MNARVTIPLLLLVLFGFSGTTAGHGEGGFPTLAHFKDIHMERAFAPNNCEQTPGSITYTLLEPARVRIRVVSRETRELYLRTIVDWEQRDAGTHTEEWDCKDNGGHPIDKNLAAIKLVGEPMSTYEPGTMSMEKLSPEEVIHGHKFGHSHNKHHPYACGEVSLKILAPEEGARISGKSLIKAAVDKKRRGYGDTFGYGVRYYIDHVLVHEEFYKPESDGKFAYELDTTAFRDGAHMLYMGMCDHNDHGTSNSVNVLIDNSELARPVEQ